jgi:two-component system, LytTR family, response regulator
MTKLKYNYLVVEDDLKVCQDLKIRMEIFDNWKCIGLIPSYDEALICIKNDKPNMLFLDYSIRGGNTFDLLDEIKTIENYNPFIIYFTGYGTDNLFISEDVNNKYKVNIFLNKPIQEKFTANLSNYIVEAEKWIKDSTPNELWLPTKDKVKIKIEPSKIICINQPENNPRYKTIRTIDNKIYDIKASWDDCERIAKEYSINYCYTKARDTIINKKYITKIQKPNIWLNDFLKITVTKERWKDIIL